MNAQDFSDMADRARRAQAEIDKIVARNEDSGVTRAERAVIVGLGGYKESGKDALADFLVEDHGFVKTFMSEPLNEALTRLNPWIVLDSLGAAVGMIENPIRYADLVTMVGYTAAKTHPEVRRLLQALGTEVVRRMIGEDTWVELMQKQIHQLIDAGHRRIVITGIRYPNEAEMIRSYAGGALVWVERPEATAAHQAALAASEAVHDSETTLRPDHFEYTVHNTRDLALLREMSASLAHELGI